MHYCSRNSNTAIFTLEIDVRCKNYHKKVTNSYQIADAFQFCHMCVFLYHKMYFDCISGANIIDFRGVFKLLCCSDKINNTVPYFVKRRTFRKYANIGADKTMVTHIMVLVYTAELANYDKSPYLN